MILLYPLDPLHLFDHLNTLYVLHNLDALDTLVAPHPLDALHLVEALHLVNALQIMYSGEFISESLDFRKKLNNPSVSESYHISIPNFPQPLKSNPFELQNC